VLGAESFALMILECSVEIKFTTLPRYFSKSGRYLHGPKFSISSRNHQRRVVFPIVYIRPLPKVCTYMHSKHFRAEVYAKTENYASIFLQWDHQFTPLGALITGLG